MSPAHLGGQGTSACHCLPAGLLYFLRPEPALAFFLMTLGRQLDSSSRDNSLICKLQEQGSPTTAQGFCALGGTLKSDSCVVVFKLGSSNPWDSVEVPQGPLRVGVGERGGSKGYTKQAGLSGHPLHSFKQPLLSGLYIRSSYKTNFREKNSVTKESLKTSIFYVI